MIDIFVHLGGVPTEVWFDNTSTLVTKILKDGGRQLTDKFLRFSEHYGFRYKFMNPESGWEKGNVENKVGYSRRNFLVPPPRFMELSEYNSRLLTEADSDMDREHYHYDQTILERFGEDKKALRPLPDVAFDPARYETVLTDKWGRFTLEKGKHEYSVSPDHVCTNVWLKITSRRVQVMVGRKNFLFHDTVKGARASSIIYSLVETAKLNNLNIYAYLETVLLYMPDYKNEPEGIEELMPWSDMIQQRYRIKSKS